MKRIAIIFAVTLALAGCAGMDKSVLQGGTSVTATIANPVTVEMQAGAEASYVLAASGVLAYMRLPRCKAGEVISVTNACSQWTLVQNLQAKNRIVYKQLANLRAFMANNQTVNAIGAYNAAVGALRDLNAIAYVNGIKTN